MVSNYLDTMLVDAISWCALRELPEEWDGEREWLKALALVSKRNGSKAYVALAKGKTGEDKIVYLKKGKHKFYSMLTFQDTLHLIQIPNVHYGTVRPQY